jgi:hypothetical protein
MRTPSNRRSILNPRRRNCGPERHVRFAPVDSEYVEGQSAGATFRKNYDGDFALELLGLMSTATKPAVGTNSRSSSRRFEESTGSQLTLDVFGVLG